MTFIALHRSPQTSLTTPRWLLDSDEASACESATDLLERLQSLCARREQEMDHAVLQARYAGYAAGHEEALRTVVPQLMSAWQQAAASARADMGAWRQAVLTLSGQVIEHIAATLGPADIVGALALRVVQDLTPHRATVVRVNGDVARAVQDHLLAHGCVLDAGMLEVRADAALGPFDCVLDTPSGQLLAGLPTQLGTILRTLAAEQEGVDPS